MTQSTSAAPKNRLSLGARDVMVRIASVPFLAKAFMGASLRDDVDLPEYGATTPPAADLRPEAAREASG